MSSDFSQRCQSALTHPLTLLALVVLLLNDWVFKSIWQSDWTTGKLSDLAWVIFASPLLAFLLSLPAGRYPATCRAAFIAAYFGLPVLYAAFNTFDAIHYAILRMLSLATGIPAGGSPDPADSLVIPLGVAVGLWIWRRTGGPSQRHARFGYIAAAVAIAASIATSSAEPTQGIESVGITPDGTLTAGELASRDGGLTWWEPPWTGIPPDRIPDRWAVSWGGQSVETPRGTYTIELSDIVLTINGRSETVYSSSFLLSTTVAD